MLIKNVAKYMAFAGLGTASLMFNAAMAMAQVEPQAQTEGTLISQVPTACPPGYIPENPSPFEPERGYNLECWNLERKNFICLNNPVEECGNPMQEVGDVKPPTARYDVDDEWRQKGGFPCVNSVNPLCSNPVHYGVLYGSEYKSTLPDRTAPLWAAYEESINRRPTVQLPPPIAPTPQPIPGLW